MATAAFRPTRHPTEGVRASKATRGRIGGRRHHPATVMNDEHTAEQTAFLGAIEHWQTSTGLRRPGWDALVSILHGLGYRTPGRGKVGADDFDKAVDDWRVMTGHRWPSWTETLGIVRTLGFYIPIGTQSDVTPRSTIHTTSRRAPR